VPEEGGTGQVVTFQGQINVTIRIPGESLSGGEAQGRTAHSGSGSTGMIIGIAAGAVVLGKGVGVFTLRKRQA